MNRPDQAIEDRSREPRVLPDDEHNRLLIEQTHPPGWINPQPRGRYNLVVIGSGTAGLTAAAGCATIGGRVALIERHLTGGDCLVAGCVPSKGIISAARVAATIARAGEYGIHVPAGVRVEFGEVMERMRRLRAQLSPADSVHQLVERGVEVYLGQGRFTGRDTVEVDGHRLQFARAVIATGGRAELPPIPGLTEAGCLTNETLFELTARPARLVIVGGGPIGCEMAQAFQRLGSQVILIHNAGHILNREDADAAEIVQQAFVREDIELILGAKTIKVDRTGDQKVVHLEQQGRLMTVSCDEILVAAGRAPNIEGLGLEQAGVTYEKSGVQVNDFLQTTNPRIYAAGDVASPFKFTHTANALGRMALVNALLWGRGRASRLVIPWCTYTDPEIAHVGLYESQAQQQQLKVKTLTVPLSENDRAVLDGESTGFVRVHLRAGTGQILGATVVAAHAGDLLTSFTLAMGRRAGVGSLASGIYPYPTQSEAIKKLAGVYLQSKLTPGVKKLLGRVLSFRR